MAGILSGLDTSDPCALWPVLYRSYLELLAGERVVTARFGEDEATFANAARGELLREINQLKAECAALSGGRARRRAISVRRF